MLISFISYKNQIYDPENSSNKNNVHSDVLRNKTNIELSKNYLDNNFPDWRLKNVKNKLSLNAYDYFILYFKYVNIFLLQIPKIIRKLIMFFFIFLKIHK